MLEALKKITQDIQRSRYPDAKVVFLAGSVIRGEATAYSDLDLVVVFEQLPCAYRESFIQADWPVEAFVHDPQTLDYFFNAVDRPSGCPSLAAMVSEGVAVPEETELSNQLKADADLVLKNGPPAWQAADINRARYAITDMIDDLKAPRSIAEMHATATVLYTALADFYCRSQNLWSAKGKAIPRRLHAIDAVFANQFLDAFDLLFSKNSTQAVFELAAQLLEPVGGFLFESFRLDAPESWRITPG